MVPLYLTMYVLLCNLLNASCDEVKLKVIIVKQAVTLAKTLYT